MNTIETRLEEMLAKYKHDLFMADQFGICKPNPDVPKLVQALRRALEYVQTLADISDRHSESAHVLIGECSKILTEGKE